MGSIHRFISICIQHFDPRINSLQVMFGRRARLPIDADLESICEQLSFCQNITLFIDRDLLCSYYFSSAEEPNTTSHMEDVSILRQSILKNEKHNILVAQV